jgi:hypothetical protein
LQDGSLPNSKGGTQAGALTADRTSLKFDEMNLLFAPPKIPADIQAKLEWG